MKDWIIVGRFTSPYGIKGWLKLLSHTEPMDNIAEYEPVWVQDGNAWKPLELEKVQFHGKGLVAKIAGCDDRTQAEQYIGRDIAVKPHQLPQLPVGEYYWSQLEGLSVFNKDDVYFGKVDHLIETGANDVLVVKPVSGSVDDRERLIPYVPVHHVLGVDLKFGRIDVDWDVDF